MPLANFIDDSRKYWLLSEPQTLETLGNVTEDTIIKELPKQDKLGYKYGVALKWLFADNEEQNRIIDNTIKYSMLKIIGSIDYSEEDDKKEAAYKRKYGKYIRLSYLLSIPLLCVVSLLGIPIYIPIALSAICIIGTEILYDNGAFGNYYSTQEHKHYVNASRACYKLSHSNINVLSYDDILSFFYNYNDILVEHFDVNKL